MRRLLLLAVSLTLPAFACGDDGGSGGGDGSGDCDPDQISVYQPDAETPDCLPIPSECNGTAACADQACAAAMYANCPGANVACSDLEGESTLITCS
ncbi:MAG: hypothetical protein R3B72_31420 [Polyangiaceae bacterium]